MLDVCLCTGEGQTRQAPFPPFYQTVLIYSTICFPSARDDAGDMWLGALRQKLACTRPAMCLPPSDAAVSSKFFAAASSQYGREQAWAGLCRRHKETKYGKEGKKGREMGWGACVRTVGRKDRQTDRWAESGRRKAEWHVEREGQELGRGKQRNGLTEGQRVKRLWRKESQAGVGWK